MSPGSSNSTHTISHESDSQHSSIDSNQTCKQKQTALDCGSSCCHPRLGEPDTVRSPTSTSVFNNHLFALIVGIDNYHNEKIRKLRGCVNDSENICRFLTESLQANPAHIRHLRDTEAKRQDILSVFIDHLINNEEIQKNDAIVFYFAGHGSYEIPEGRYPAGCQIETICPYDDRMGARGIPDRTFASLMNRLAVLKGDNITAIFDSCYSGGMGRMANYSDMKNSRFLPPPESRFPAGLDDDIWSANRTLSMKERDCPYTPCPQLKSHVLLAACQHHEVAYETPLSTPCHHAGAFTSLLLDILRQPGRDLAKTTYIDLLNIMQQPVNKLRLPMQTPYVEGDNKTRILFSMANPGRYFSVLLRDDGKFSVAAGTIHGVDAETEFTVTSGTERLEKLKPFRVSPLICTFKKPNATTLRDDSRAEVTKWNQLHSKVFFQQAHNGPAGFQDYGVVISHSRQGRMQLDRRDGLIPRYAEKIISFSSQDIHAGLTSHIFATVTHFNFHLLRESHFNIIGEKLRVKLQCLSPLTAGNYGSNAIISYFPSDNEQDVFISGEKLVSKDNIDAGPKVSAAVKLPDLRQYYSFTLSVHNTGLSLFPYVFGFDPATYEIANFYHPEPTKEGPLHEGRVVTIGYGPEGGYPIHFYPNEVTFFKILVTSTYVDLKGLVQASAFSKRVLERGSKRCYTIFNEFWESWVYVVRT